MLYIRGLSEFLIVAKKYWFKKVESSTLVERFDVENGDCVVWRDEEGVQWTLGQLPNNEADVGSLRKQRKYYDLMLNDVKIGDGSIRIHNSEEQTRVLNIPNEGTTEKNHLLDAISCGAPPHGGFALGLDRYIALLVAEGDPSLPVREFGKPMQQVAAKD
ncbi:hypothetical protein NECAME_11083 [Necator americanus]|uniref:Aminoacyl-tRNA synthetase class II (D/K/N) domain-containing protein n=1 Tax=Necator americanus TaxID=51031 RepID=W2T6A3_NECAM|nr:hypothetical protein NECAME_11083 [Necator americanus]ETN77413.1 hypothetical protein NECAME_11083 [Necator americanus]